VSVKEILKQAVKKKLTDRCDQNYDRIYSCAQKKTAYKEAIVAAQERQWQRWQQETKDLQLPVYYILKYSWEKPLGIRDVLEKSEQNQVLVLFLDERCTLSEHALDYIRGWFAGHRETLLLYGDEDVQDSKGVRSAPWLKPDWSPDLLYEMFYPGGVFAVERKLLQKLEEQRKEASEKESLQVHQLFYRLAKLAGGYAPAKAQREGLQAIAHIPTILCHHRDEEAYHSYLDSSISRQANAFKGKVSIVIPSKDQPVVLARNLASLERTVSPQKAEIILVDNGSSPENQAKVQKMTQESCFDIQYIYESMDFHFSKMCNLGAVRASGELLLFLNDDVEAIREGWLEEMAAAAMEPYAGAVGAKLLYPGTRKIQHAGIVNLPMGPVHKLQFCEDDRSYYFNRNRVAVNVLAVTGACLMVSRDKFISCGGFPEELPVAFNDVSLCFSLWEQGYYNVVLDRLELYHHESLSRGGDESCEKAERLAGERRKLYRRHPDLEGRDPFYHPWLNRLVLDMEIAAAPEETMNLPQTVKSQKRPLPKGARLEPGLFVRIERLTEQMCAGYSFMLGDDNACYEKWLLWEEQKSGQIYQAKLVPKLRSDLQRNMPDQKNVGMCGFAVQVQGLPAGHYRIGVLAHNKVTRVSYLNWSNRSLQIQ